MSTTFSFKELVSNQIAKRVSNHRTHCQWRNCWSLDAIFTNWECQSALVSTQWISLCVSWRARDKSFHEANIVKRAFYCHTGLTIWGQRRRSVIQDVWELALVPKRENEKLSNCPTSIPGWGARGRAQRVKGGIEVFYPGLDRSCPPITCPRCCAPHHLCVDVVSYSACRALTNPSVIFPVVFHEECVESGIWPISGKAASSSLAANLNKIHTQTASIHTTHLTPRPTSYQNLKRSWGFFGQGGIGELGWKDENWKEWDHFMYVSFSLFTSRWKKQPLHPKVSSTQ